MNAPGAEAISAAPSLELDPDLAHQLALAGDDTLVEAVLFLRQDERSGHAGADAAGLLRRVCQHEPSDLVASTAFPRLRALLVRGRPRLIRHLIVQPEVEMACANRGVGAIVMRAALESADKSKKRET